MEHGNHASGIHFSVSAGHSIPNFVISAEPDQRKFMSRVVVCVEEQNGKKQLLKLLDINEHIQNSRIAQNRNTASKNGRLPPVHHDGLTYPFLTLQEILSLIRRRVSGLQEFARQHGFSDHVNYHCMFCQAGTVPEFWKKERRSVIAADRALLRTQRGLSTPLKYIGHLRRLQHYLVDGASAVLLADAEARRRGWTRDTPTRFFTTPPGNRLGQGAVSRLTRTFSSPNRSTRRSPQSSPNVRNAARRSSRVSPGRTARRSSRVSPGRTAEEEENNLERNLGQFLAEAPEVQRQPLTEDFFSNDPMDTDE